MMDDYEEYKNGKILPTYKRRENVKILEALNEKNFIQMLFDSINFAHDADKKRCFEFMRLLID